MKRIYSHTKKNNLNKSQSHKVGAGVYLDYAATTPLDKEVKKAMEPYLSDHFGNPNSLHYFGQQTRAAVDLARERIAKAIGADFNEIIFTGSATEANNLALRGIIKFLNRQNKIPQPHFLKGAKPKPRIIVLTIEHDSVLETAKDLEKDGIDVVYLPVDRNGVIDLKKLKNSLNENTVLVSIMYANNEIGTIQPLFEISKIIEDFKKNFSLSTFPFPLFHTDAVQAFQFLDCNVDKLGVDALTLSAHKIYGPKGIGVLYIRQNYESRIRNNEFKKSVIHNSKFIIPPLITGGGQEFGLRSGTENVAGIVGFAKAIELADKNRAKEFKKLTGLKNYFLQNLKKIYPALQINSSAQDQLPNMINVYFPGYKSEDLLIKLDMAGIAVSSGSACASFSAKPSHVLEALGYSDERIKGSLRFSFGKFTVKSEINEVLKILKKILV